MNGTTTSGSFTTGTTEQIHGCVEKGLSTSSAMTGRVIIATGVLVTMVEEKPTTTSSTISTI
jgi:hypothetical protein